MKKNIAIIVPYRGVGDILFHSQFFLSIYKFHKKKLILYAPYSSKANLIYKGNRIFKKIILTDLKRPNIFLYIIKIISLTFELSKYKYDRIYYTGNNRWHRVSFLLLSFFSNFKVYYFKNTDYYIIDHLKNFLKKLSIDYKQKNNFSIKLNISKKFKHKTKLYKKPWAFISIDTAENQIIIPNKFLRLIIKKLNKKYKTVFVNTSFENKKNIKILNNENIIPTYKYNILEIFYIMKFSRIFIGNDSGPGNLSSLLKKKSIIFLSKNTKGEILEFPFRGKRRYFKIENIKNNITKILNFI